MDYTHVFPKAVRDARKQDPPGSWMPTLPPNCIRLSAGYPAPELVPIDSIRNAVYSLIDDEKDLPFHYLGSQRANQLADILAGRMQEREVASIHNEPNLLVTSGGCQAIDLIARTFLDQDACVVVEGPTYMEALEIFKNYTSNFISIPLDQHGLRTDLLESTLVERKQNGSVMPRILYTIPTFQNPSGTTMQLARRKHLLELAKTFDFLIVEDDAYGELSFDEQNTPTLKSLDNDERVLYIGSLSKVVAPGMRIGWIGAHPTLIETIAWFKKDLDHPFAQATVSEYLVNTDFYNTRLPLLREQYQIRRDAMLQALSEWMPKTVSWHIPNGGYFVWIHVPNVDTSVLLKHALEQGVSFVPGKYFFLHPSEGLEYLRLSFSYEDIERMQRGVQILGTLFV